MMESINDENGFTEIILSERPGGFECSTNLDELFRNKYPPTPSITKRKTYMFFSMLVILFSFNIIYNIYTIPISNKSTETTKKKTQKTTLTASSPSTSLTTSTLHFENTSYKESYRSMQVEEDNFLRNSGKANVGDGDIIDVIEKIVQGQEEHARPSNNDNIYNSKDDINNIESIRIDNDNQKQVLTLTLPVPVPVNITEITLTNPLRLVFQDLNRLTEINEKVRHNHNNNPLFPYFWSTFPDERGRYRIPRFLEECFNFYQERNVQPTVAAHHHLEFIPSSSSSSYNILSGYELSEAVNILNERKQNDNNNNDKDYFMFTLLIHPVQRAAMIFQQMKNDPTYKDIFRNMDLLTYANLLGGNYDPQKNNDDLDLFFVKQNRWHMSNWLTRSLSSAGQSTKLTVKHGEEAEIILREKVLVGLYDSPIATIGRIKTLLHLNKRDLFTNELDACLNNCVSKSKAISTARKKMVKKGSQEYIALAKINYHDILLYNKAQYAFWDQAKLVNLIKPPNNIAKKPATNALSSTILKSTSQHEQQIPFFWDTLPLVAGKLIPNFFDICFDLNRAVIDGANGSHRMVHASKKKNPHNYNINNNNNRQEEDIVTAYNINEALFYFKNNKDNNDSDGKKICDHGSSSNFLTLLMHPIQRAALEFNYYKIDKTNPNYDKRIENISILNFAEYLLSTKDNTSNNFSMMRYKMNNYLTNSLLQIISSLNDNNQKQHNNEIIVQFIKDQCMQIGLIENLGETYYRYSKIILKQQEQKYNNDIKNEEKIKLNNCVSLYAKKQKEEIQQNLIMKHDKRLVQNNLMMIVPNSKEWNVLEKLNKNDIYLYEKIKEIFIQQGSA